MLEDPTYEGRLKRAIGIYRQEAESAKLEKEIMNKVQDRAEKDMRENMLRMQMRAIEEELGGNANPKKAVIEKFTAKLAELEQDPKAISALQVGRRLKPISYSLSPGMFRPSYATCPVALASCHFPPPHQAWADLPIIQLTAASPSPHSPSETRSSACSS